MSLHPKFSKPPSSQILLYTSTDGRQKIEVMLENETVWLSQDQMSQLFGRDQSVISRHIKNAYTEGELQEKSTMQNMHNANSDKPVAYYNLDVIISVGYRVKSVRGTQFRIWATQQLKEYLIKGFVMNDERLAEGKIVSGVSYFDELLQRVRAIRASEKNLYQKVRDIFATSTPFF